VIIPVVGVGASAGGLEAFKLLLSRVPRNSGLAIVFVQHLDPKHHSNLDEILARVSPIPVQRAADGTEIEPNRLYVIAPDSELQIVGSVLRTRPRNSRTLSPHMPIDRFMQSLAKECGSRAIGVILSGAGTDGGVGLEAVKAAGGVTFAQDPATARFDGMPRAAIERGSVDFVLPTEAIAEALTRLGRHPYIVGAAAAGAIHLAAENERFAPILSLLHDATDVNFGLYRESTIQRRIVRRLALRNLASIEDYRKQLENDPGELAALQKDLLLGVTQFFRDPESFERLKSLVFPRLIEVRANDDPIRIWAPGCATGEEAYSIAISFDEYLRETGRACPVQIFATDISESAIQKARRGKYDETIVADVGEERIGRYFVKVNDEYQVIRTIRELCVFSRHDLMQDPPFSRLDLISCRNVLIFFGGVRKNVIALFHYALKTGGFLVLGPAEKESSPLFSVVPAAPNIYTGNEMARRPLTPYAAQSNWVAGTARPDMRVPFKTDADGADLVKETERALLARYVGTGIVVDETLEVLEIVGRMPPCLRLTAGKASLNLLRLIPDTRLFLEVEMLVREVQASGAAAGRYGVPYQAEGAGGELNLEAIPLRSMAGRALLVVFEPVEKASQGGWGADADPRDAEIARLKQDVADAHARVLSIVEGHRSAADEELSATEEVISANEELLSLNEELQTAKKELQSSHDELAATNAQLIGANAALTEARDSAMLIVEAAPAPLLVLDIDLRIKRANSAFCRAFKMSTHDAEGQFLYSAAKGCWDIPEVRDMLERILPEHESVQDFEIRHEFPGVGAKFLLLSARQLDGLQILFGIEDITERERRTGAMLVESEGRFRTMADAAPVMIWVSGDEMTRIFFNKAWLAFTGRTVDQELRSGWTEGVYPGDLHAFLNTCLASMHSHRAFQTEYRLRRADGEYRWVLENGVPRFQGDGAFAGYIGSCLDITSFKKMQEESLAKQKLESVGTLANGIAHDFNNLLGGILAQSELGLAQAANGSMPEEELRNIRAVAIRGGEIARQLMVYAGQESAIPEEVDVSAIVGDMLELLKVSLPKSAALEPHLGKDLPSVRASAAQVRQIVLNLVTNASEAIGDHPGVIRVSTRRQPGGWGSPVGGKERSSEPGYVQLDVSDTGQGIPVVLQSKVFDPFFTTKSAGHGLGLAVVQGLVRSLHGEIRLSSQPGKGTTFQILLPVSETPAAPSQAPMAAPREAAPEAGKGTILVVEDEEGLRAAVSKTIRKAGLSAIEASDGSTAMDTIRNHGSRIDLLFLDFTLPGNSSREVFEEAQHIRPKTAIIVTSAYEEKTIAMSWGVRIEHFLRKPYRLGDLMALVREILSS
jgi:two-component system, chemotaxis family, CheB/CheR fusion protein